MSNDPVLHMSLDALAPARLAALPRVRLRPSGDRVLVTPPRHDRLVPPPFEPFPLPVVPGHLMDALAKLLRVAYRRTGRPAAAALLFLDPTTAEWSASFPTGQPALSQPAVADLAAAMRGATPPLLVERRHGDGRLLAGGYLLTPTADAQLLTRQVPEADGLWLFHLAGTWAHAGAFVRAGGHAFPLDLTEVAADLDPSGEVHPNDAPWVVCPA